MVILEDTPRGPWEPLFGVICLRLARGPGCRSEFGIPWKPPESTGEEAKNRNNPKLMAARASQTRGWFSHSCSP